MKVDAEALRTRETDDRGRVSLGTEYANKRVTVAVIELDAEQPDEAALAAAYRESSESATEFTAAWDETSDEAWADNE